MDSAWLCLWKKVTGACKELLRLLGRGDHIFVELEMWTCGTQGVMGEMVSSWLKETHYNTFPF